MQQEVLRTLKYFAFFDYSPTFEQIHAFLRLKTTSSSLKDVLAKLIKANRLSERSGRYTLGEYKGKHITRLQKRISYSNAKRRRVEAFLRLISLFPQIKLIGLSGSVAMANAKAGDDIDLFIVSAGKRLWTARFICLVVSSLFGRRKFGDAHTSDKLCLNLFFDEARMAVPKGKQNVYVAHEILQMKPLFERGDVYDRFLDSNKWVYGLFPNGRVLKRASSEDNEPKRRASNRTLPGNILENILRTVQLSIINRHKTTEIVTDTQLWFFPDDFEKKLNFSVVNRPTLAMGKKKSKRR